MSFQIRSLLKFRNTYVILLAPILLLPLPLTHNTTEARCAYVFLIMAVYWITEAVPLYVTALLPIFGLPLAGVMASRTAASFYVTESSIVFAGGLVVAVAIEHCNLHRRIAMLIIIKVGQSPRLLMAGFMLTTMILSMWISNTGATAIMVTVVEGILDVLKEDTTLEDAKDDRGSETTFSSIVSGENDIHFDTEMNEIHHTDVIIQPQDRKTAENSVSCLSEALSDVEQNLHQERLRKLKYGYYLSIAYASNIGGTGVITGTPPNLLLQGILAESFTESTGVNFTSWMMLNTPGMIICTLFGWLWLQYRYIGFGKRSQSLVNPENKKKIEKFIHEEYINLGPMTYHEKSVAILFMLLIPLWIFRDPGFLYGWGKLIEDLYGASTRIGDSVPVVFIIFLYFVLPSKNQFRLIKKDGLNAISKSEGLLTWKIVQDKVAWGLIILLGGGVTMAKASDVSGLSKWMGQELSKLDGLSPPAFLLLITTLTSTVTEILSNSAATSMVLPVLRELSLGLCTNPLYFMIPATVSASFAFMLPVATPGNAIVYYAGGIPSTEMMKTGFFMNLICIAVLNGIMNILGGPVFDMHNMPPWANSSASGTLPNC